MRVCATVRRFYTCRPYILTPFFSRATLLSAVDDAREGRQRKDGMSQRFAHLAPHARCYVAGTFRAIVR